MIETSLYTLVRAAHFSGTIEDAVLRWNSSEECPFELMNSSRDKYCSYSSGRKGEPHLMILKVCSPGFREQYLNGRPVMLSTTSPSGKTTKRLIDSFVATTGLEMLDSLPPVLVNFTRAEMDSCFPAFLNDPKSFLAAHGIQYRNG